jgi:hypothetical protein
MTAAEVATLVDRTRAAQGLDSKITDRSTLDRLAAILARAER